MIGSETLRAAVPMPGAAADPTPATTMQRALLTLLSTFLLAAPVACKTTVHTATEAPALGSDATIVAKKNKTGTYAVSLDIINLAPASRLDPEATTFVVWLVSKDAAPVRAGVLAYDEGDRQGALEATSPNSAFNLLVTLEKETSPAGPNGKKILDVKVTAR